MRADQAPRTPSWLSLRPEFWRKDLLRVVLRVTAVLGTCTWVPSTWLAIKLGMVSLFVLDTAVLASVITLGLAERSSSTCSARD